MAECDEGLGFTLSSSKKQKALDWLRRYDEEHPDQALHHALFGGLNEHVNKG